MDDFLNPEQGGARRRVPQQPQAGRPRRPLGPPGAPRRADQPPQAPRDPHRVFRRPEVQQENVEHQDRPEHLPRAGRPNQNRNRGNNWRLNRNERAPKDQQQQQNRNERGYNDRQNNRNDGGHQNRSKWCMGFKTLEEIARCEDSEIIIEKKTPFMNLLESDIDNTDMFVLIMEAITKLCSSSFDELKLKLLLEICNSRFVANLRNYLMDLPYAEEKLRNKMYWNDQTKFWRNFVTFCEWIVNRLPSTAVKCRSLIEGASKCCLEGLHDRHGFVLPDECNRKLVSLRERLTVCEKSEKENVPIQKNIGVNLNVDSDPPDDFRELSVLPTCDDLVAQRPFLRPNIVDGSYRDTDHYLDVQFRLLREDCIGPLREGIRQYIENPDKKKYDNIRVYKNVKFVAPYISTNKVGEIVKLDEKASNRMKRINWAYSKRFIYGSLLLFTKDNCRSFITATILERDPKLLNQGMIPVSIANKSTANDIFADDSSFCMIESDVYFEPYFHVLKALQDVSFPENLAMNQYIVHVDPTPNPPRYLDEDKVFAVEANYTKAKFKVLDELTWPTKEDLGFDDSQYEAYKLALTHEFAVIQGPPGTGKTYLGVKIAKTLIQNLSSEKMLVICYTNHALDQFLEALLPVTKSIVRIGGQSHNDAMKKLNLTELRKNENVSVDVKRVFFEERNNLKLAVSELQHAQKKFDSLYYGVISYDSLKERVPVVRMLGEYYAKYRSDVKTDPLRHWLFERRDYVNFDDVIAAEIPVEENGKKNANVPTDMDEDERVQVVLDDFGNLPDSEFVFEGTPISTSFSVSDAEAQLNTLILLYRKTQSRFQQQKLQFEIVDLKSRLQLFNDMFVNRTQETRRPVTQRTNFAHMSVADRWTMYFKWANVVLKRLKTKMKPLQKSLETASTTYEEVRMMMDLHIVRNFAVVGMTTSGAARLRKLLLALAPSIVIVEEAAEVLEQHIVTSLTKSCKHLILIGDHQQLRPSASHMILARRYNIEVSLFERMISNGMHSRRLGVQHRMRPELAALIVPHIYTDLANHPSVENFPRVRGITDNLFFFTHHYKEEDVEDSSSRSNQLEADMTLKLANYLMQQGYEPGDVTILAAYSGQMFYMRKQRENYAFLSKVKITVVDNYQGEESKIILLSLVRNNDENKIGFLATTNRVCVALSRAKEGFFILGNIEILKNNSEIWGKIAKTLQNNGSLGTSLMLKCEHHSDQITTISSPKDFDKVPEGGCLLKCEYNLPCGHRCTLVCHGYDRGHVNIKCYEKCERELCELKHVCPLICSVKCEPCKCLVEKDLPCGHKLSMHCYLDPADPLVKCPEIVTVTLPNCGHEVKKFCSQKTEAVKCPVPCIYRVKQCGHDCQRKCHVRDDPDHEKYVCQKPCANAKKGCTANLIGDRGDHQCQKKCFEDCDWCTIEVLKKRSSCKHSERVACNVNVDDTPCRKKCARMLTCQHFCKKKCFEQCGDCDAKVTKTIPDCNHQIEILCKNPPTRELCRQPCERTLECGHPCNRRCDQPCDPSKCTKLIDVEFSAPCGHQVKLPCNVYNAAAGDWNEKILLEHCSSPCGQWLACEHECQGTCGGCRQGRLHQPCRGVCGRTNVCGHVCKEPCNQVCPPCNRPCETRCPHSKCDQLCGAPCTPCKEECTRRCAHGACRNRCGEPCSRPPCDEACARTLPCGHACRGLCGEPCPDICKTCRPEQFPKGFIGEDFEDDVKFVSLQDCPHVLDVESMDTMMMADKETIEIRKCPFCCTPVINTYRYKDLVNQMFKHDINPVKERVFGNVTEINNRKDELFANIMRITFSGDYDDVFEWSTTYKEAIDNLVKIVKKQKKTWLVKLNMQFQYVEILEIIAECYRKYQKAQLSVLSKELLELANLLCTVLSANVQKISQQLQQDIANEIKRMNSIIQMAKILSHTSYLSLKTVPKVKEAEENARRLVLSWLVFDQVKANKALKELEEAVKVSGIVSQEERALIVKALGSKIGSWYKCPNGHIYGIDQCGGAMQVSKCADCGASIGGTRHTLLPDNSHAADMDGSSYAAWSNAYNNMGNWQL